VCLQEALPQVVSCGKLVRGSLDRRPKPAFNSSLDSMVRPAQTARPRPGTGGQERISVAVESDGTRMLHGCGGQMSDPVSRRHFCDLSGLPLAPSLPASVVDLMKHERYFLMGLERCHATRRLLR